VCIVSVLMLLGRCQAGHPDHENPAATNPKSLLLGTGLNWSNMGWLKYD